MIRPTNGIQRSGLEGAGSALTTTQAARQLRADLRKQQSLPVYVMDLAPNYRVCLGDFRDRWSADEERRRWLATYPTATVIPCPIAPPPLPTEDVHGD